MRAERTPGTIKSIRQFINESLRKGNLWDDARFVLVDVPVNPQEAKKILPWGMRLSMPPKATLFVVNYTKTSFTVPYKEAAVLVHVRTPLGKGLHCPWMVVNDDTALIYGRELLGYPKKLADIVYEEKGNHVHARVTRRGVTIMSIEGVRGPEQIHPPPVFNHKTFNAGGLGQFFAVQPIWMLRPQENIHSSHSAQVSLTLAESEYDPIAGLVSGKPLGGRMVVLDIPGGRYLLPVGLTGLRWFLNTYNMRFR